MLPNVSLEHKLCLLVNSKHWMRRRKHWSSYELVTKKCVKWHLIYNIFIKFLHFFSVFSFPFQSLVFLFLRCNQLQPEVLQALEVFQTSLDKALNNLFWPVLSRRLDNGPSWGAFQPHVFTLKWIQHFIRGIVSASIEKKCLSLLCVSDSYVLNQVYHINWTVIMKKAVLWLHFQKHHFSAIAQVSVAFITRGEVIAVFKTEVIYSLNGIY